MLFLLKVVKGLKSVVSGGFNVVKNYGMGFFGLGVDVVGGYMDVKVVQKVVEKNVEL